MQTKSLVWSLGCLLVPALVSGGVPEITLNGESAIRVAKDAEYQEIAATATDEDVFASFLVDEEGRHGGVVGIR
jgi:hypothetical protein